MTQFLTSKYKTWLILSWIVSGICTLVSFLSLSLNLTEKIFSPYSLAISSYRSDANPNVILFEIKNNSDRTTTGISAHFLSNHIVKYIEASAQNRIQHKTFNSYIISIPNSLKAGASICITVVTHQAPLNFDLQVYSDNNKTASWGEQLRQANNQDKLLIIFGFFFFFITLTPPLAFSIELYRKVQHYEFG